MDNIWFTWGNVFNSSLQGLWFGFVQFLPKFLLAIIFFVVGYFLGSGIAKAIEQICSALKIDKFASSAGAADIFRKAGINLNVGYFIGQVVKWFIVVVFLLPSLDLVGLNSIKDFLQFDVLGFLPRVIIAVFILVIASVVSEFISGSVTVATKSMNLKSAHMLGTVAKYAVWIFGFIIALGQLGVAPEYMSVLFTGIVAMLSLGGALAFGLGGRDAAASFIAKLGEEVSHK